MRLLTITIILCILVPAFVSANTSVIPVTKSIITAGDTYLQLSTEALVLMSGATETLELTLRNIDTQTRNFSIYIGTSDSGLSFYFNNQELTRTVVGPDMFQFILPAFTDFVANRTNVLELGIMSELPAGLVYKLSFFDIYLSSIDGELECYSVGMLSTKPYSLLDSYQMNKTGRLSNDAEYHITDNPVQASSESCFTISVNNTDTISHEYTVNILDRVGNLKIFKGSEEIAGVQYSSGVMFTIDIGEVHSYDSLPLTVSVSQVQGAEWSRHMIEAFVSVDGTNHDSVMFGLDVGNSLLTEFKLEKIVLQKIDSDHIRVTMTASDNVADGVFALLLPDSDIISVLQWTTEKVATTVLERVVFPVLFEAIPASGLTLGIAGFVASMGVGLIIKGLFLLPEDPGMGTVFILAGVGLVVVAIVLYLVKQRDGGYYL